MHLKQCRYCNAFYKYREQRIAENPVFWNSVDHESSPEDASFALLKRKMVQVEEMSDVEACATDEDSDGGVAIE